MDIQLLNRWFNKGYSSREMATFLLLGEATSWTIPWSPELVEKRWAEIFEEVCKHIYLLGPPE